LTTKRKRSRRRETREGGREEKINKEEIQCLWLKGKRIKKEDAGRICWSGADSSQQR
jgi:hypothetical protein